MKHKNTDYDQSRTTHMAVAVALKGTNKGRQEYVQTWTATQRATRTNKKLTDQDINKKSGLQQE